MKVASQIRLLHKQSRGRGQNRGTRSRSRRGRARARSTMRLSQEDLARNVEFLEGEDGWEDCEFKSPDVFLSQPSYLPIDRSSFIELTILGNILTTPS